MDSRGESTRPRVQRKVEVITYYLAPSETEGLEETPRKGKRSFQRLDATVVDER